MRVVPASGQHPFASWTHLGTLGILLFILLSQGCTSFNEAKVEAETKLQACLEISREQQYEQLVMNCYSPEFFNEMPKEEWIRILQGVDEKLGKLQGYELATWRVENRTGTNPAIVVQLTYQVQYEKYEAREEFWLRKQREETQFLIIRHSINSKGLLLE